MNQTHRVQVVVFVLLTGIIRVMPIGMVRAVGRGLGALGFLVLTSRRRVTLSNLRHAYPDSSDDALASLAKASFRSVGEASLELGWLSRLTPAILKEQVVLTNAEVLGEECRKGRGMVIVVSHYAGWEFILQGIHRHAPGRTHVVYKPMSNTVIDAIVLRWRSRLGLKWIPIESAVNDTMEAMKKGDVVILAADQSVGRESIWTSFFGRDVPTAKGPAALCLKTGGTLYLSALRRQRDGSCTGPLVQVETDDLVGYNETTMRTLTQRLTSLTETYIRDDPGQWMWTHKRWKHATDTPRG